MKCKKLTYLDVSGCTKISSKSILEVVSYCNELKYLNCQHTNVTELGISSNLTKYNRLICLKTSMKFLVTMVQDEDLLNIINSHKGVEIEDSVRNGMDPNY